MRLYTTIVLLLLTLGIHAQSINTEFGKNRVQYHDDFDAWKKYETENFVTHWYGKAQNIALPVVQMLEEYHGGVNQLIEHRINDKIQVIVYTDVTDVKQSNIGVEDLFVTQDGRATVLANKLFVYYSGDFKEVVRQVKEGIARVYLDEMLIGANIREKVQNAVTLRLPTWYTEGIVSYAARDWDYLLDDELRDILHQRPKRYTNFRKLALDYPRIAGHSFWYFISSTYGRSTIPNVLYLTRLLREEDEAFLYILNEDMPKLFEKYREFYKDYYSGYTSTSAEPMKLKKYGEDPVSVLKYSPNGKNIAYVRNRNGRVTVRMIDSTGRDRKLFRYGKRNTLQETDFGYPVLTWDKEGTILSIFYEDKDKVFLKRIPVHGGPEETQLLPTAIYRVYSADMLDDENYVLSASLDGYSDLITYKIENRNYNRITHDYYEDRDAVVTTFGGSRGILFSSTRLNNSIEPTRYDSILPVGDYNIFFYDLEADDGSLFRITDTPDEDERFPISKNNSSILYLSNSNGINNVHEYELLRNTSRRRTDFVRNAIRWDYSPDLDQMLYTFYYDGSYEVYCSDLKDEEETYTGTTYFYDVVHSRKEESKEEKAEKMVMQEGYKFVSAFKDPDDLKPIDYRESEDKNAYSSKGLDIGRPEVAVCEPISITGITSSPLQFRLDDVQTTMDNSVMFEGMETYTGKQDALLRSPMGLLMKADFKDLLEDYFISVGARFPLAFNGSEYFGVIEDRKRRIDKKYVLYRKHQSITTNANNYPVYKDNKVTWLGMAQWKYPWDPYRSLRVTPSLRFDTYSSRSLDRETFNLPADTEERIALKAEYIYDNSIIHDVNILNGTRYKVYAEFINEFNIGIIDDPKFQLSKGVTSVVGFDFRHYIPVLKHSVFALRGAGATSFGYKRNLYYLGDVNNSILGAFNQVIPISRDETYAYKTNAHHLRGFSSNIRNGTSYVLANVEMRIPLFKYLLQDVKGWNFMKRIQVVGFADAGTAFYGVSPYDSKNPLNRVKAAIPPIISVDATYKRDPFVLSTGAGLRFMVVGYVLRVDMGWGLDSRVWQKPKFHLSVGKDF